MSLLRDILFEGKIKPRAKQYHNEIRDEEDFLKELKTPHVFPGGYAKYFIMADGGAACFAGAKKEQKTILKAFADKDKGHEDKQWIPVAVDINWENDEMICDITGKIIEPEYSDK